jgi:hypothetical protein
MLIRYLYMTKFITVVALVMGLTGCATLPNNPPSSNTLTVEHVDSNAVQISNITVRQEGSGIKVSGNLRNRFNQRRIDRGHLHIEIFGDNGEQLFEVSRKYRPNNANLRQWPFVETLPVQFEEVVMVRVQHHPLPHHT